MDTLNCSNFVYQEVWLHELVPQHATNTVIKLTVSLDEMLLSTIDNHGQLIHAMKPCTCQHLKPTSNSIISTNKNPSNNHFSSLKPISFNFNNLLNMELTVCKEKELWKKFWISLNRRGRKSNRDSNFHVEFTEHIYSKLFNGKVHNYEGCKVKNRIIRKNNKNVRK